MTEQEKNLIIRLWESGEPASAIVRLLPYDTQTAKSMIMELRQNGAIKGRSGKTATRTWEKVLQAYNDGITNPYEIAELLGLKVGTINWILGNSGLNRKRPNHNYKPFPISEKTKEIIERIKNGETLSQIAKSCGVSRQYVYKVKDNFVVKKGEHNELQTTE